MPLGVGNKTYIIYTINIMKNKNLDKIIYKNIGQDISYSLYSKYVGTDVYRELEKKYLKNMPVDDYYWYYMYLSYLERLNEI